MFLCLYTFFSLSHRAPQLNSYALTYDQHLARLIEVLFTMCGGVRAVAFVCVSVRSCVRFCTFACACPQVTGFRPLQLTQSFGHRSQCLAVTVEVALGQHGRHQSQDGPQGAAVLAATAPGATRFLERVHAALELDQTLSDAGVLQTGERGSVTRRTLTVKHEAIQTQ